MSLRYCIYTMSSPVLYSVSIVVGSNGLTRSIGAKNRPLPHDRACRPTLITAFSPV
ncbi:MAG: hypothetical protein GQ577_09145 [Woeseiaceae bacterium]|nr:hypothetical protein [Woeseiaceae bacterium]